MPEIIEQPCQLVMGYQRIYAFWSEIRVVCHCLCRMSCNEQSLTSPAQTSQDARQKVISRNGFECGPRFKAVTASTSGRAPQCAAWPRVRRARRHGCGDRALGARGGRLLRGCPPGDAWLLHGGG